MVLTNIFLPASHEIITKLEDYFRDVGEDNFE